MELCLQSLLCESGQDEILREGEKSTLRIFRFDGREKSLKTALRLNTECSADLEFGVPDKLRKGGE